jgi:hypothetical protein
VEVHEFLVCDYAITIGVNVFEQLHGIQRRPAPHAATALRRSIGTPGIVAHCAAV